MTHPNYRPPWGAPEAGEPVLDEITPELFDHLVELAALELTPEEARYLRGQLNSQLRAIHLLERIPVPDDVPPAAHGVTFAPEVRPHARPDETRPCDDAERILTQAPEIHDRYFVVPDIPHAELS